MDYKQVIRRLNTAYNLLSDSLLSEKKKKHTQVRKNDSRKPDKIIG